MCDNVLPPYQNTVDSATRPGNVYSDTLRYTLTKEGETNLRRRENASKCFNRRRVLAAMVESAVGASLARVDAHKSFKLKV